MAMSSDHDIIHMFHAMRVAELQAFSSDFMVLNLFHAKNCFNSIFYVQLNIAQGKILFQGGFKFC